MNDDHQAPPDEIARLQRAMLEYTDRTGVRPDYILVGADVFEAVLAFADDRRVRRYTVDNVEVRFDDAVLILVTREPAATLVPVASAHARRGR